MGNKEGKEEPKASAEEQTAKTINMLEGQIRDLNDKITKKQAEAMECAKKGSADKVAAARGKQALKMKMQYSKQLEQRQGQLNSIMGMQAQLEEQSMNKMLVDAMKTQVQELKANSVDVAEVDKLRDEMEQMHDDQQEIADLLQHNPFADSAADDSAMDELNAMYAEAEVEEAAKILAGGGASSSATPAVATPAAAAVAAPAAKAAAATAG
mmetsp:Transcript_44018/g.79150  ORF Transcript_44018/g.79150 Transcript_44018/m.79150 type:complete len:211 (+) Transcript_44018:79-711(+)